VRLTATHIAQIQARILSAAQAHDTLSESLRCLLQRAALPEDGAACASQEQPSRRAGRVLTESLAWKAALGGGTPPAAEARAALSAHFQWHWGARDGSPGPPQDGDGQQGRGALGGALLRWARSTGGTGGAGGAVGRGEARWVLCRYLEAAAAELPSLLAAAQGRAVDEIPPTAPARAQALLEWARLAPLLERCGPARLWTSLRLPQAPRARRAGDGGARCAGALRACWVGRCSARRPTSSPTCSSVP